MTQDADILPNDIDALRAALLAERAARHAAETRASGAEALITHLKLLIATLQRDRFGLTSERSRRLLGQLELQLKEFEADTAEAEANPVGSVRDFRSGACARQRFIQTASRDPSWTMSQRRVSSHLS